MSAPRQPAPPTLVDDEAPPGAEGGAASRAPATLIEDEGARRSRYGLEPGRCYEGHVLRRILGPPSGEAEIWEVEPAEGGDPLVLKVYGEQSPPRRALLDQLRGLVQSRQALPGLPPLDHDPIYRLIDSGIGADKREYELMPLFPLGSLSDWLARTSGRPRLSDAEAKHVLLQLYHACAAMQMARPAIIHRDIKPGNLLLLSEEPLQLVLIDFGIARATDQERHKTKMLVTPRYAAPETVIGKTPVFGAPADWWSIGVVMLELLHGPAFPHDWNDSQVLSELGERGIGVPADLSPEWQQLLQGLFTRSTLDRWGPEQVGAWLQGRRDIDVHYERPGARQPLGYTFGGGEHRDALSLGRAMADDRHWPSAVEHVASPRLARWCGDVWHDDDRAVRLDALRADPALAAFPDLRTALAVQVLDPTAPALVIGGERLDESWHLRPREQAEQVKRARTLVRFAHTDALARLQHESAPPAVRAVGAWLARCRARSAALWRFDVALDPASGPASVPATLALLLLQSPEVLARETERLLQDVVDAHDPRLQELLARDRRSDVECIALLFADPSAFVTAGARARAALRAAVAELDVPVEAAVVNQHVEANDAVAAGRAATERRRSIALTYHPRVRRLLRTSDPAHHEAIAIAALRESVVLTHNACWRWRGVRALDAGSRLLSWVAFAGLLVLVQRWPVARYGGFWAGQVLPVLLALAGVGALQLSLLPWLRARLARLRAPWHERISTLRRAAGQETREGSARGAFAFRAVSSLGRRLRTVGRLAMVACLSYLAHAHVPASRAQRAAELARDARQLAAAGDLDAARARLATAAERYPREPIVPLIAANVDRLAHRLDDVQAHLVRAAGLDPYSGRLHREIGMYYLARGWRAPAERAFERAILLDPNDWDAMIRLGCLMLPERRGAALSRLTDAGAGPEVCR